MRNPSFLTISGGLSYHATALRYRESLWSPFCTEVLRWLTEVWNPSQTELILFGSSAGWTIPQSFLERFESVTVIEPDISARLFFRFRFRSVRTKFEYINKFELLPWFEKSDASYGRALSALLARQPNAAILFTNVLGQIPLHLPEPARGQKQIAMNRAFLEALKGRTWASYHDLWSTDRPPRSDHPHSFTRSDAAQPLDVLVSKFFKDQTSIIDHETLWLSLQSPLPTATTVWQIRPGTFHVIGFTHKSAG